jgi:hypothetical protein
MQAVDQMTAPWTFAELCQIIGEIMPDDGAWQVCRESFPDGDRAYIVRAKPLSWTGDGTQEDIDRQRNEWRAYQRLFAGRRDLLCVFHDLVLGATLIVCSRGHVDDEGCWHPWNE